MPSRCRLRYALELMQNHDPEAAEKCREDFEKTARTWPYEGDIQSERELMALVDARAYGH